MALRRTRLVQSLPSPAAGVGPESQSSRIGHINLGAKQAGKPSAGNPHAGFDVAGTGNRPTVRLVRHSQRKRGATDRLSLRGNRRQSSTLLIERGRETYRCLWASTTRPSSTLRPERTVLVGAASLACCATEAYSRSRISASSKLSLNGPSHQPQPDVVAPGHSR